MDVELIEIREFLAGHPPFDQLPAQALDRLPKELSVRYLRRGSTFPPKDADGDYLYVLRKGAVDLRDADDGLAERISEGGIYAACCIRDDPAGRYSGTTVEDTLLYLLPCERFEVLCRTHEGFGEFFTQSLRQRLRTALEVLRDNRGSAVTTTEVRALIGRSPVCADPKTTIREAARLMSRERVSSLLLMEGGLLVGILTDRDLRSRCIAEGLSYDLQACEIMTRRLHKISPDTPAFEALMTMTRHGVHHLPVVDGRGVLGVISTNDLIRHQSTNAVHLTGSVRKCASVEALADTCAQLPEMHLQMLVAGATGHHVGQAIASVADAATRRLIELAQQQLGPAPVPFAWLAVGSQARRELTIHSDQDSALLLDDSYGEEHAGYFAWLAGFVTDGLARCGFVLCPGEVMARNQKWRQPYRVWRRYFDDWITRPERMAVMLASNFFDMRVVYGEESLYDRLHAEVLQQASDNRIFLTYLAAGALHNRPPLGFFRNFVLISDGDHANTLDLKHKGIIPIIDLARFHALAAGLPEINTLERLRAAGEAATLSREGAADLEDALEFMSTMRVRHQAGQIKRGEQPDNYIRPDELSALERNHLKDAFAIISTMQNALGQRHQSGRFF